MSDELKKALETEEEATSVQTDATEQENEDTDGAEVSEEESTDSSDVEESKDDIDYKALLEIEQSRREKAEKAIVKMKKADKKVESDDDWGTTEDDHKLGREDLQELLDANNQKLIAQLSGDYEEDALESVTSNPDERKLIRFHLENTIKRTGASKADIRADVLRAKAIANADKLARENEELKVTARANKSITNSGTGSSVRKSKKEDVDPQAQALIKNLRANKM